MGKLDSSSTALMENWQRQFSEFAKKDNIGLVMWETANLLNGLLSDPICAEDLENSADSLSKIRVNTQKKDGTFDLLNLEELRRAYCEL
ncbi:hypothetical protein PFISCL1PPCAC_7240, partial [Pristionchus fissidentatus]